MKVLELFAGSCSFSKVAMEMGAEVHAVDIKQFGSIDRVVDIMKWDYTLLSRTAFKPDIIWASPPCTYFSVASIGKHWNKDNTPKTPQAEYGIRVVKKTVEIIEYFEPEYWFIENPRGKLRKLGIVPGIQQTVTYCQYGDKRMKPTDIWTNTMLWQPRPLCKNGDTCHESAPRGSKTGTQGLKGNYERSKVPYALCAEILKSIITPPPSSK